MSITDFFTEETVVRTKISRDESGAASLILDAAISMNTTTSLNITKNPVESGGNITDNATIENLSFNMEAVVTEDTLPNSILDSAIGALAGAAGGAIGIQTGGLVNSLVTAGVAIGADKLKNFALSPDIIKDPQTIEQQIANRDLSDTDYPRKAYEYLLSMQQSRIALRVTSGFKTYSNLLIKTLSAPRVIKNGKSLFFSATFEQVQFVSSNTVTLPENVIAFDATGASSKAKKGKQGTKAATGAQAGNVSIVKDFINGFGG